MERPLKEKYAIDITCSYKNSKEKTSWENSEKMPRGCSTISEFFPSYVPESESDGSVFESIPRSSEKRKQNDRDEKEVEGSKRGMSCKSIESLMSVTYFADGFETDLKPFSGSLCPRV